MQHHSRFAARCATLTLALAAPLLAGTALAADDVRLGPATATLPSGETLQLSVGGENFASLMLGGGLSFSWDPDVLDLASVQVDAATWEFARDGGLLDAAAGTLTGMYFASFNGHAGSFPIATLRFVADQPGITTVAMSLFPSQPFANEMGEVVDVNLFGSRVTVTAVPEPGAWALLLAGLLALPRLSGRR
ncbi:MAG: hypothetical protein JNM33_08855 [Rubrivivax sp.]|nr:hypothetical protein [Rubrivivax sp.]